MFTGIIETLGKVIEVRPKDGNIEFVIEAEIWSQLQINQSVSHNGACLSVTSIGEGFYTVTAIQETLKKTALAELKTGDYVNLERSMPANGRFDGHMVLGHVDKVGICQSVENENGSHIFTFKYDNDPTCFTVEKGSIGVNGISLTVVNSKVSEFSVAIIPYTYNHTNLRYIYPGSKVNLEFDILGKYIHRLLERSRL